MEEQNTKASWHSLNTFGTFYTKEGFMSFFHLMSELRAPPLLGLPKDKLLSCKVTSTKWVCLFSPVCSLRAGLFCCISCSKSQFERWAAINVRLRPYVPTQQVTANPSTAKDTAVSSSTSPKVVKPLPSSSTQRTGDPFGVATAVSTCVLAHFHLSGAVVGFVSNKWNQGWIFKTTKQLYEECQSPVASANAACQCDPKTSLTFWKRKKGLAGICTGRLPSFGNSQKELQSNLTQKWLSLLVRWKMCQSAIWKTQGRFKGMLPVDCLGTAAAITTDPTKQVARKKRTGRRPFMSFLLDSKYDWSNWSHKCWITIFSW